MSVTSWRLQRTRSLEIAAWRGRPDEVADAWGETTFEKTGDESADGCAFSAGGGDDDARWKKNRQSLEELEVLPSANETHDEARRLMRTNRQLTEK